MAACVDASTSAAGTSVPSSSFVGTGVSGTGALFTGSDRTPFFSSALCICFFAGGVSR